MKWNYAFAWAVLIAMIGPAGVRASSELPPGFVYVRDVDPTIVQDIRYAGRHNFVGRPIAGYNAAECVLTEEAAGALSAAQADLAAKQLSLIAWDCYRPTRAVADFRRWSKDAKDSRMKDEFFPRTAKARLFSLGYLANRSAHSRGSTVDVGIVPKGVSSAPRYDPDSTLVACFSRKGDRFEDGTIDLGTGYDCLDELAGLNSLELGKIARDNRELLRSVMRRFGFKPYSKEWWHFEFIDEPFPDRSFDFPIPPREER